MEGKILYIFSFNFLIIIIWFKYFYLITTISYRIVHQMDQLKDMPVVMKIICNLLYNHLWIILNLKHMKCLRRILLNIHNIKLLFIKQLV